ncbi:NAD-dependent epimerase/dehydratase family protein [Alkalicoccobacillus porphyridii]|uniref:NAD-dependent epimerase/dehydratase family protein n=1 Tax=Alkalicoccobacillus porphyridii TaxID=2597270 RepID=A0A554A3U6_9BACI|nr:NAD-dependent epimerase/dehydratase family protein [Alkalicoccobacillus porphyridii]TSB48367.1 NAD-dependent epimerase/dehydratase family protein [Alkalicoccobacillus porphyridii]
MKVLITGGAGFIGRNLVEAYLERGDEVVVVDIKAANQHIEWLDGCKVYGIDIRDEEFISIVKEEKPDLINHHAAQIDVQSALKDPSKDASINILGTINVLEACKQVPGCKLIYPSSAAVYGTPEYLGVDEKHPIRPLSMYGMSKFTPEDYIRIYSDLYDIPYTIFRYANVYGRYQDPKGEGGVICVLMNCALKHDPFTLYGDGQQTRDFIHVADITSANLMASNESFNDVFNISTGKATSLLETISLMEGIAGFEFKKQIKEERKGDIKHSYLLNDKAKEIIGWTPQIDIEKGLGETFSFYQ